MASASISASTEEKILRARSAAAKVALLSTADKNSLLLAIADSMEASEKAILDANAADVEAFRSGDDKVKKKKKGYLAGEIMKATNRTANMKLVNQILDEKLS